MKKQFKKYPRYTADQRPFLYYTSSNGTDMTVVSRSQFLSLVCSTLQPDNHIYIDYDGVWQSSLRTLLP